ncbi:hypothetical protein [Nocardia iowensis]|uniref:Beta-ketoacyl-[acyl-carrier-protein] synthase III N-terminal domain-containing protein n=1 Tax=Nocardia iowensis TaxID=204891 RepID=A0ABX8RZC7_NOCIO|nr:hypothetical protein [Nocardia iowensis]QXN94202.1 hypothetical protein KV110_14735 [Nocardia iowensis]
MATTIVAAATNTDLDTGSYFELAARAARSCLADSDVSVDEVGMLINAGVFRDDNISEPAVSALIQKRIGLGLEYQPGRVPAFSFDLMHGATGLLHAISTAECFLATGEVEYALLVAGDTHPSTQRYVAGFPYTTGAAALLLGSSPAAGGFGRLYTSETTGKADPSAWVALGEAGANGRSAMCVRHGAEDPIELAAAVVRDCVTDEDIDGDDFAAGRAVLLAPAPALGFRARLAETLGLRPEAVVGVDPAIGDPYSAAPVHAYVNARESGVLGTADTVLFLAADDAAAACLAYRPQPAAVATVSAIGAARSEKH